MTLRNIWILPFILPGMSALLLTVGCGEDFVEEPPFTAVSDTVFLDVDAWYYVGREPSQIDGVLAYPFSYQIFETFFDGFLLNAENRVYTLGIDDKIDERALFLDTRTQPGDTLYKNSAFRYNLVIDVKRDEKTGEEVFYILRRSKIGVRRIRERAIWVISPTHGILAVADFSIGYTDGQVTLNMVGDPDYFRDPQLINKIKYYDNDITWLVDQDRHVIYEFDKYKAVLKSRDFQAGEDLYEYKFNKINTRELIDFRIKLENNSIKLIAGDSCFYFSDLLELLRSTSCPNEF
ncbi:MAG: hypothetical protein R3C61_18300 [Bacteroidia bacterium]